MRKKSVFLSIVMAQLRASYTYSSTPNLDSLESRGADEVSAIGISGCSGFLRAAWDSGENSSIDPGISAIAARAMQRASVEQLFKSRDLIARE